MYIVDIGRMSWILSDEILDWCWENIAPGQWHVEWAVVAAGRVRGTAAPHRYPSLLYIHRDEDAVYLKLRWS